MSVKALLVPLVALLLLATSAQAASVANRDDKDHKITVVEGENQTDHVLKPDAVLDGICQKGCLLRLDGNETDPYRLEGSESTSIEGGDLFVDESGPMPSSPETGGAIQPSAPGR